MDIPDQNGSKQLERTRSPSLLQAPAMASDPANDDWVKIYELQKRANEEMEARKIVKRK